jgi:hypothetical protein
LCPKILVVTSSDVQDILQENGIPNLSFLLNPLATTQVQFRDSNGQSQTIPDFSVRFSELDQIEVKQDDLVNLITDILRDPPSANVPTSPSDADENAAPLQSKGDSTIDKDTSTLHFTPTSWNDPSLLSIRLGNFATIFKEFTIFFVLPRFISCAMVQTFSKMVLWFIFSK